MINTGMTVREVAIELPQSTRLFETLKIDYCCGGNRPLSEACAAAGVDVGDVMDMLTEVTQSDSEDTRAIDFQNASLPDLITHILKTHHVFTKTEMQRLKALSAKVTDAHGTNHPELFQVGEMFRVLSDDLTPHMFKEEQILFPYILSMVYAKQTQMTAPFAPFGTVNNPVRMMMREHDTAGQLLRDLRALTFDYQVPDDACISYRTLYQALENFEKDLHQHIHLENNLLFPKALELENELTQ